MAFKEKLTYDGLAEVSEKLRNELIGMKVRSREINNTLLLMEEIFVRLSERTDRGQVEVRLRERLGDVDLVMSAEGDEYDPISELKDWTVESEDYYRALIIRSNRDNLSYVRSQAKNVIVIRVHSADSRFFLRSLAAMGSGLLAGLLLWALLPRQVLANLDYHILEPFKILFVNAMGAMVVPAVFCSIVNSINSLGSLSDAGRLGRRVMAVYMGTTLFAILISIQLGLRLFGPFEGLGILLTGETVGDLTSPDIHEIITGIIPSDLVSPILTANILQVMYMSVLSGVALVMLGDKAALISKMLQALDLFFQKIISIIALFVPVITFISTVSMMIVLGPAILPALGCLILGEMAGCFIMVLLYGFLIIVLTRLSPFPFYTKTRQYVRVPFMAGSGGAVLLQTVAFCKKDLGVREDIASFTASLGATVNMDGSCIHLVLCSMLLVRMYGIRPDSHLLFTVIIAVFLLSLGASAVQNSSILALSTLVTILGISPGALGMLLGVDQILDMFRAASNVVGDISTTVIVGHEERALDKNAYYAPPSTTKQTL